MEIIVAIDFSWFFGTKVATYYNQITNYLGSSSFLLYSGNNCHICCSDFSIYLETFVNLNREYSKAKVVKSLFTIKNTNLHHLYHTYISGRNVYCIVLLHMCSTKTWLTFSLLPVEFVLCT